MGSRGLNCSLVKMFQCASFDLGIEFEEDLLFYEMAYRIGKTSHHNLFYSVILFLRVKYAFRRRTLKVKKQNCMVVRNAGTK